MGYRFKRNRSDLWIIIHENDGMYNISVNEKYVNIINHFFPILEGSSPNKWRISAAHKDMSTLWLPNGCCCQEHIEEFINWCDEVTKNVLWLKLNKKFSEYFYDELDYCIASDFNYNFEGGRTEIGEAEYQLKYNGSNLSNNDKRVLYEFITSKMLNNFKYIPINSPLDWCVSPMPANESGKSKIAWKIAEEIGRQKNLPLIEPIIKCNKPQMKTLPIDEKINVWDKIYCDGSVIINGDVGQKNVIIVDDLYQSGATMWSYAKFLKSLGAKFVFGVVCVKSLRDSDNT